MKHALLKSVAEKLLQLVITLAALIALTFFIGRLLPADPVGAIVGEMATPEAYAAMRERLGLDQPVLVQFGRYIGQLLQGDLGVAVLTGRPVLDDIAAAFPATIELATLAIVLSFCIGVPLGLAAALYRDSIVDQLVRALSLLGHSVPVFWLGILGLLVFYAGLGWVAGPGRLDVWNEGIVPAHTGMILLDSLLAGRFDIFGNALSHIMLPASLLAYASMAYITRMTRAFTLEQLGQDYVVAARAKGAGATRVLIQHVLPNIAVQLVTIATISYGALLEGSVVTEIVFSWPGIGQYMTSAILIGDMNAVLAVTVVIGVVFMLLNAMADIAYTLLDPRTKEAR